MFEGTLEQRKPDIGLKEVITDVFLVEQLTAAVSAIPPWVIISGGTAPWLQCLLLQRSLAG